MRESPRGMLPNILEEPFCPRQGLPLASAPRSCSPSSRSRQKPRWHERAEGKGQHVGIAALDTFSSEQAGGGCAPLLPVGSLLLSLWVCSSCAKAAACPSALRDISVAVAKPDLAEGAVGTPEPRGTCWLNVLRRSALRLVGTFGAAWPLGLLLPSPGGLGRAQRLVLQPCGAGERSAGELRRALLPACRGSADSAGAGGGQAVVSHATPAALRVCLIGFYEQRLAPGRAVYT